MINFEFFFSEPSPNHVIMCLSSTYRKLSYISRIKSQNLNDSGLVLQLTLPNPLKPDVTSRMKIQLEQRRQAPFRRQAIIWNFVGMFYWHVYASLGLDELTHWIAQNAQTPLVTSPWTLDHEMVWCHQATSHYRNQCWPRSMSPYGVTSLQ